MAYREKVWNANVLTDLLSTYLTHKSAEREKYYQAELKRKPTYKAFGDQLVKIGPDGENIETVMTKKSDITPKQYYDEGKGGWVWGTTEEDIRGKQSKKAEQKGPYAKQFLDEFAPEISEYWKADNVPENLYNQYSGEIAFAHHLNSGGLTPAEQRLAYDAEYKRRTTPTGYEKTYMTQSQNHLNRLIALKNNKKSWISTDTFGNVSTRKSEGAWGKEGSQEAKDNQDILEYWKHISKEGYKDHAKRQVAPGYVKGWKDKKKKSIAGWGASGVSEE